MTTALKNQLLRSMSAGDNERLRPHLEHVFLRQGQILHDVMQPIEFIHFIESGLSSEIATNSEGQRIEVGCVGQEGFTGLSAVLGVRQAPHRSFMETDGSALRITPDALLEVAVGSTSIMPILLRYVHVFMVQIAATALADGRYGVEQRTARWLLMSHDRMQGDELPLTHEFLSLMLGVRRSSVTDALHVLEGSGTIKATRGLITVRDREKLEQIAGASYGVPEAEYRRVIGASPS